MRESGVAQLTLNDLPEVFVPFETAKANKGKIVYCNSLLDRGLGEAELLSRYSYTIVYQEICAKRPYDKKKFFAERYGGDGILTNGGGARCGFDGSFQLKGIGANKLVSVRPPNPQGYTHANGFLSLSIAIHESIWAEVVQRALPYGAVRTVAIIDLDVEFEESNTHHARALLIRLPAVRPAHFIRALYFKEKKHGALSEDAKRVALAIQRLVSFLPQNSTNQDENALPESLSLGMVELATRYAKQFSAARSKRIYHANVSASNITTDGAWMDLAGSAVFSERLWWNGFNIDKFKAEYAPAINSINDMCFYLNKYGVISLEASREIFEKSLHAFNIEFEKNSSECNAVQAGFPLFMVRHFADNACFLDFSEKLKKILTKDKYIITPVSAGSWIGYEHWISRLYLQLFKGKNDNEVIDLSWLSGDDTLLSQMITSYGNFFDLVVSEASAIGVSRKNIATCIAINLTRLNRCNSVLVDLYDEITDVIRKSRGWEEDKASYDLLFKRSNLATTLAFEYNEGSIQHVWDDESTVIQFDALTGLFMAEDKKRNVNISGKFSEVRDKILGVETVCCFYQKIIGVFHE